MAKPVYALVGSDLFLQLQSLRSIFEKLPADTQRVDVEGDRAELADVMDELRSYSMFGGYKLVVVRDASDFLSSYREQLEDYVAKPSDSATLVLRLESLPKNQRIYKAIDKTGEIVSCEPPKLGELSKWAIAHAKQAHDLVLDPGAAQVLVDLIGADLGRLDNELAKLAVQSDGKKIGAESISTNVVFQREQQMWDMTDMLSQGKLDIAIQRWRHLVASDPSSEIRAVTWLALWVEKAGKALAMKQQRANPFAIAKALQIWPAQNVDKLLVTVERLGEARLRRAVDELLKLDRRNKTGLGDPVASVERFMLSLQTN